MHKVQVASLLSKKVDFVARSPDAVGRPLPLVSQALHVQLSLPGGEGPSAPGNLRLHLDL